MNLFFAFYIAVILYITIPICKIIWNDLLDRDLTFLLLSNYILIFLLSIIFNYQTNLIYSILLSLTLMISAFCLIRKIKDIYGHYQLLSIPYFIFSVFVFSNILVLI
ncbi:MAG: hypothetical protein IJY87_04835 [Bacilli bacterium]|nr:hypothetical protein [Bacilli bacterium]MBQ8902373.1 hypothetical protein [Bacilli bacterium]